MTCPRYVEVLFLYNEIPLILTNQYIYCEYFVRFFLNYTVESFVCFSVIVIVIQRLCCNDFAINIK